MYIFASTKKEDGSKVLLVDDRAGSSELIPFFPPELTRRCRLEAGDVAFFGWGPEGQMTFPIGVEYKTARESLQCLIDKRLEEEQLPKMTLLYKRIYLVIEGEYKEGSSGELLHKVWKDRKPLWTSYSMVTYTQFDNWLNSLAENYGIRLKRAVDRPEAASQIYDIYKYWVRDYAQHKMRFSKDNEPVQHRPPTNAEIIARRLPGVGSDLVPKVGSQFRTPIEVANATEEQWQSIPGIGKKKAQKIYQFWRT